MTNLVIPEVLATQLEGLPTPIHLHDAAGRTLGYFVPLVDPSGYEIIGPELGQEELSQIEQSPEWYSTVQVLHHLESLG